MPKMNRGLRVLALCAASALLLSCGGGRGLVGRPPVGRRDGGVQAPALQKETTLDEALAELDALETPEGVDEVLFSALKAALARQLGTLDAERGTLRITSNAPIGPKNRIKDLSYTVDGEGVFTLTWSYRNVGDYNQDGIVNIMDITPLAVHFHEFIDPETHLWEHPVCEVIDGSGDGAITILDITPLAANFFVNIDHYKLLAGDSEEGPFEEAGEIPLPALEETPTGRRQIAGEIGDSLTHFFWCVAPVDAEGNEGEASNVVHIVVSPPVIESISPKSGHSGDELEIHAVISGTPPKSVTWDFGGGAEPNTTTERTPTVLLGAKGRYTASLSVTTPYGEDSTTFYFTVGPADSDWMFYLVDEGSDLKAPSLAVIDGRPAIGYKDWGPEGNGPITEKYAVSSEPDGSGEWTVGPVEEWSGPNGWGIQSRLVEYRGAPALLYWHEQQSVAVNDSPQGTGEWGIFCVAEYGALDPSPVVVGNWFAVSFRWQNSRVYGSAEDLRLAVNGPGGALDTWTISDIHAEPEKEYMYMSYGAHNSLAVAGGRLGVAYQAYNLIEHHHEGELWFAINNELDGSGEWKRYLIERSDGGVATGADTSLAEVEGRPAIAYCRQEHATPGGNPNRHSSLKFTVNTKSDGSGYWNRFTLDSGHWADNPSLAVVGGRPAIAFSRGSYRDFIDRVLVYGECSQADGTGVWKWEVLDPRPDAGVYPSLCVLADGRPAIAYLDASNPSNLCLLLTVRDY